MRDNITIYRTQMDAIRKLDAEDFKTVMLTMVDYVMDNKQPDCTGTSLIIFELVKPLLDKNNANYENAKKRNQANRERIGSESERTVSESERTDSEQRPKCKMLNVKSNMSNDKCDMSNVKSEMLKEKSEMLKDNKNTLSDKSDSVRTYPYAEVIGYLNQKAGTAFMVTSKDTRKHIRARIDEGFTVEDFKTVIDHKVTEWGNNPDMVQYLRPSTLFGTKFESYLNQKVVKPSQVKSKNKFCNFPQREYDWDNLEAEMLKNGLGEA